jgi:copper transport outer membrane protein MctB
VSALRRYLFGVLAICTAFAMGVALGGGPLRGHFVSVNAREATKPATTRSALSDARRGSLLDAALTTAATQRLVAGRLTNRSVTVVALPLVPRATVAGLVEAVRQAGGLTPVVARLSADVVNPAKKTYVDSVASSALQQSHDVPVAAGADTYERIGAVLARAYVGTGNSTTFDSEASRIDAELQGARLVTVDDAPLRRGSLVLVIAPRSDSRGQYAAASRVIQAQLVTALARRSDGAVLVSSGSDRSANVTQGWPPGVRAGVRLATLNVSTGSASRVAAVYALAAVANGRSGDYGVSGRSARLPPGLAVPRG